MGVYGPINLVGEGHHDLGGSVQVQTIVARVIAATGKTRFYGSMYPRGAKYVGEYGLGSWPGDAWNPAFAFVAWSRFMTHEAEAVFGINEAYGDALGGSIYQIDYFPSFFWRFSPGVTVEITVSW